MTLIRERLTEGARALEAAGVPGAMRDARVLMAAALDTSADRLTLVAEETVPERVGERFAAFLEKRLARMPVARIVGKRLFWGREFWVPPEVLDPRPETEILIATALEQGTAHRILDLGTGSGIIAVTLLAEWEDAVALGTDISGAALTVASTNAAWAHVEGRFRTLQSDWYSNVTVAYDLIVSNPPYIAAAEMEGLAPEVRLYDPEGALTDGGDGRGAYRAIAAGFEKHLNPGGRVLLEIGPTQAQAVSDILAGAGLVDLEVHHDFDGRDRVVSGRAPG